MVAADTSCEPRLTAPPLARVLIDDVLPRPYGCRDVTDGALASREPQRGAVCRRDVERWVLLDGSASYTSSTRSWTRWPGHAHGRREALRVVGTGVSCFV